MKRICTDQGLKDFFSDGKPHHVGELEKHFKVSLIVVYREMKRIQALRSINKTGYYILQGNRRFDRNGFLEVEDKVFFSGGDLSEALVHLISKSRSGMNYRELKKAVSVPVEVQLLNLTHKRRLYREKFRGEYVYFSPDKEIGTRQVERRRAELRITDDSLILEQLQTVPLELVIKILLTFIHHPGFTPKSIALSLLRRGEKVATEVVEAVFAKYGLSKKKLLTVLLLLHQLRRVSSTDSLGNYKSIPQVISLPLCSRDKENCLKTRFQMRCVKSVRLGQIKLKYETGKTAQNRQIHPADLQSLVPRANTFAYNTILSVTRMRFGLLMQREEIQQQIALESGFHISTGSISNLSSMGLAYLEQCHFTQAQKLAERYRQKCFFIHLDGTNEGGKYTHFVVREGMSGNVLYGKKIISESEASIVPVLKRVKELFGDPEAVISDMSPAIKKAVKAVFKNVPHRLCHFHFLKDIGKDMLHNLHQPLKYSVKNLQNQLKEFRTKFDVASLSLTSAKSRKQAQQREYISWFISMIDRINDYEKDLSAEGFPFDLTYLAFYERCRQVYDSMEIILVKMIKSGELKQMDRTSSTTLSLMRNTLQKFLERLTPSINQINKVNGLFLQIRDILHPKTEQDRIPLNWGMIDEETKVQNIEKKLEQLTKKAEKKVKAKSLPKYDHNAWNLIYKHLKKYAKQLNPEIQLNGKTVLLPRTNNLSETGFRDAKRKARRTTGKKNLSKYMDELPSQYFYIINLEDPDYVKTVFGAKQIHGSFSQIDKEKIKRTMENMKAQRRSPTPIDFPLIRKDQYLPLLVNHFSQDLKKIAG